MIMSSTRPVTKRSPSRSKYPVSPVKYQPSRKRLRIRVRPPPVAFEGFIAREQRDDLAFLARRGHVLG